MKADSLFVGLNLNTYAQAKTLETCTFHGWCFKNKEHEKYLNVETRLVVFSNPIKILVALLVLPKDLVVCSWFDLCGDC